MINTTSQDVTIVDMIRASIDAQNLRADIFYRVTLSHFHMNLKECSTVPFPEEYEIGR